MAISGGACGRVTPGQQARRRACGQGGPLGGRGGRRGVAVSEDGCSGQRAPVFIPAAAAAGTVALLILVSLVCCICRFPEAVSPSPLPWAEARTPTDENKCRSHWPLKARADGGPLVAAQSPELVVCLI